MATTISGSARFSEKVVLNKLLLLCGIISSLLYVAANIFIPMQYPGYNLAAQTVSELSAVGAPTRQLWVQSLSVYSVLVVCFGWGIWRSAGKNKRLRVASILLAAYAIIGMFWPPMHQREVLAAGGGTLTDTLHIAFTMITVPLMLMVVGFGATSFGKTFRVYSIISVVVIIVFGVLTGLSSPRMEANLPTPWMGVLERVSIGAYMLWIAVWAVILLRGCREPVALVKYGDLSNCNKS